MEKNKDIQENLKFNISAVSRLHDDLLSFSAVVNRKIEQMEDEIDEILIANNKGLLESIKKSEEDIKNGRITVCKTEKDIDSFFNSL